MNNLQYEALNLITTIGIAKTKDFIETYFIPLDDTKTSFVFKFIANNNKVNANLEFSEYFRELIDSINSQNITECGIIWIRPLCNIKNYNACNEVHYCIIIPKDLIAIIGDNQYSYTDNTMCFNLDNNISICNNSYTDGAIFYVKYDTIIKQEHIDIINKEIARRSLFKSFSK